MIIFFVKDMAYFQQENKICIAVSILILVDLALEWLLGRRNEQILS